MKRIIIHAVPVATSLIWLLLSGHPLNPFVLKGPAFLKFYLILLIGFYASAFILKKHNVHFSRISFSGMVFLFILGAIKLIRGMVLGKPIGFLLLILILEFIVLLVIKSNYINFNTKQKFPDDFKK